MGIEGQTEEKQPSWKWSTADDMNMTKGSPGTQEAYIPGGGRRKRDTGSQCGRTEEGGFKPDD